jgi:Protein of unknown function (DUF4199)
MMRLHPAFAYISGQRSNFPEFPAKENPMRKVTTTFGLIAGVTISIFSFFIMALCEKGTITFDKSDFIGYGSMIIALSMIFFGIKSYRDNYQNGAIKFGKGLQVGLLITLLASLIYAAVGETHYQINPEAHVAMMDKYADYQISKIREKGTSPAEIDQKVKEMADLKNMHKNPVIRFGITLAIILPVGIVITLFSAALLRRREFLPA